MQDKSTLNYIKIFFLIVIICAIISIAYKGAMLVKNSSFKYKSFNVLFIDKNAYLVHVEGGYNRVTVLKIENGGSLLDGKSRFMQSLLLGTFVDATVTSNNKSAFNKLENNFISFSKFANIALNRGSYKLNNLNEYDLLKIYLDASATPNSSKEVRLISKINSEGNLIDNLDFFQFADPEIFNGIISIQVLNGTDVDGFATRVGAVLQSLGFNVVETASTDSKKSSVTSGIKSENIERVAKFINASITETKETGIADIKMVLGEDLIKK